MAADKEQARELPDGSILVPARVWNRLVRKDIRVEQMIQDIMTQLLDEDISQDEMIRRVLNIMRAFNYPNGCEEEEEDEEEDEM